MKPVPASIHTNTHAQDSNEDGARIEGKNLRWVTGRNKIKTLKRWERGDLLTMY